jgi:excisionase family DNA binding protein
VSKDDGNDGDWTPPREVTQNSVPHPLMTIEEVCKYLGVSKSWVYKAVENGELPHFRAGGIKFSRRQIAAYLNRQQGQE